MLYYKDCGLPSKKSRNSTAQQKNCIFLRHRPFNYKVINFVHDDDPSKTSTQIVWEATAKHGVSGFEIAPTSKGVGCDKHLAVDWEKLKAKRKIPINVCLRRFWYCSKNKDSQC